MTSRAVCDRGGSPQVLSLKVAFAGESFTGSMTITDPGGKPAMTARWKGKRLGDCAK